MEQEQKEQKFNIGDKVRVICPGFNHNEVGKVTGFQTSRTTNKTVYMLDNIDYQTYSGDCLELVESVHTVNDPVNHPSHYTSHPSGIECIEITRHHGFNIGNAIKYLWRAGLKPGLSMTNRAKEIEDLEKAVWYIKDHIEQLKKSANENETITGGQI